MNPRLIILLACVSACAAPPCGARGPEPADAAPPPALSPAGTNLAGRIAHYCAGIILDSQGTPEAGELAARQFEAVLAGDPGREDVVLMLARNCLQRGETERALKALERGFAADPRNAGVAGDLIRLYAAMDRTNDLIRLVGKASGANPTNGTFRAIRTELELAAAADEFRAGRRREAAARLDNAAAGIADGETAARYLNVYLIGGDTPGALRFARRLPDAVRSDRLFNSLAAILLVGREQYRAATGFFRAAERRAAQPDTLGFGGRLDADFYFFYGMALERSGDAVEAEKKFEKCISMDPARHEAYNYLAYMWAERSVKLDAALRHVNTALGYEPDSGAYVDTLGWIYFKQGRLREAGHQIRRAMVLSPDEPEIIEHLGDILLATGEDDKALGEWKKAFVLDASNKKLARKLSARGIDLKPLREEARTLAARRAAEKDEPDPHQAGGNAGGKGE